jgi:hypothetical protein
MTSRAVRGQVCGRELWWRFMPTYQRLEELRFLPRVLNRTAPGADFLLVDKLRGVCNDTKIYPVKSRGKEQKQKTRIWRQKKKLQLQDAS